MKTKLADVIRVANLSEDGEINVANILCYGAEFRHLRNYGFFVLQFLKLNNDEQEISIGPKSFPVERGKVQHFSLGSQQFEMAANYPIIRVFVCLNLVGKD